MHLTFTDMFYIMCVHVVMIFRKKILVNYCLNIFLTQAQPIEKKMYFKLGNLTIQISSNPHRLFCKHHKQAVKLKSIWFVNNITKFISYFIKIHQFYSRYYKEKNMDPREMFIYTLVAAHAALVLFEIYSNI